MPKTNVCVLDEIVRAKGGTAERVVKVDQIEVPDLWFISQFMLEKRQSKRMKEMSTAVLECWHLCHDLLKNIKGQV